MAPRLNRLTTRLASPAASLAAGLLLAGVLAVLPGRVTEPIRGLAADLLRPGQTLALSLRRHTAEAAAAVNRHFQTTARLAETETKLKQLEQANTRLTAELAAARSRLANAAREAPGDENRLLVAKGVPARVLGHQARAYLARRQLLDVGTRAGVEPDALVLDAAVFDATGLIDRGADAELGSGQLVLAAGRVWGKIAERGANISVVRPMTESGYRDLVELGDSPGIEGILEGTGERLARVRLVEVDRPVAVGDPVYSAAAKGVLPVRPLCGTITRLERPVGAAYWEIWVEPAVANEPDRVAVLRIDVNPARAGEEVSP